MLIDGAHVVPYIAIDVQQLDVDLRVFCTQGVMVLLALAYCMEPEE